MADQVAIVNDRKRFKRTPAGTIPVDWEVARLGDITEIRIGGTPSRNKPDYWDTQMKTQNHWVAIADMKERVILGTRERITDLGIANSNVKRVPKGSVIMSFKLTIGRVAVAGADLYTNEAIAAFIPKKLVDSRYLACILGIAAQSQEADIAVKGRTLNKAKLQEILIAVPPLDEQIEVAGILSAFDDCLDADERLLLKCEELKMGLMERLLIRGIRHKHFKQTDVGRIPRSWQVQDIESIAANIPNAIVDGPFGSNLKTVHYRDRGVPVIQSGFVTSGRFRADSYVYVDDALFRQQKRSRVIAGDIVMAKIGAQAGTCAILPEGHPDSILAGNSLKITPDPQLCIPTFLVHMLQFLYARDGLSAIKTVTAQPAISLKALRSLKVPLPPLAEQKKISETFLTVDDHLSREEIRKTGIEKLKKGLMQLLLDGRVRVSDKG